MALKLKCFLQILVITFLVKQNVSVYSEDLEENRESYDFIIVGGGVAGCVIARRLVENGRHSVLVLEAGPVPAPGLEIPAIRSRFFGNNSEFIRNYNSIPQNTPGLAKNRIMPYTVGHTLGGGSSINGMWFNRGSPHDFDNWAIITGDSSWSYRNLLKYFKRSEDYRGDFPSDQHARGGPITVSRPKYSPGLSEWLQAGRDLGYSVTDPNGPQRISFSPIEYSKRFGRRVSAYSGYIKPVLDHPNLKIITRADVRRITFEGNSAVGVIYNQRDDHGDLIHQRSVRACKEIILSAGVINTPTILMKSGVGPLDVLRPAGIPVVKVLPVGMNLQDHIGVTLNFMINNQTSPFNPERDLTMENFLLYNRFGDGPYSTISGNFGQAFLASSKSTKNGIRGWPDLHLNMQHSTINSFDGPVGVSFRDLVLKHDVANWEAMVSARARLTRPQSRGRVTLNLADIEGDPLIDFQYLSHPDDIQALLESIEWTLKIYEETPAYQKLGARYTSVTVPECRRFRFRSEAYWRCHIRHLSSSSVHAAGTCRMGRGPGDRNAVVDPKLRVIGIENLRVADTSVMGDVTNANTQAPTYAIAEKAADMILKRWN